MSELQTELPFICQKIGEATGTPFEYYKFRDVGGGCISDCLQLRGKDERNFFVKTNAAERVEMFQTEADGLRELAHAKAVRVPKFICVGVYGMLSFIVQEYVAMSSPEPKTEKLLGQQLANLHRRTGDSFGWHRNNTIGSTPQINVCDPSLRSNWPAFFREKRLRYQFQLAAGDGAIFDGAEELMDKIDYFFELDGYKPVPSLLHGDLWIGNVSRDEEGQPVIYDPAVYYGDREADIAFTEMFGGLSEGFYQAYNETWPLADGYSRRKPLYNLYHILNHHNLFGGSYGAQAQAIIHALLSNLKGS